MAEEGQKQPKIASKQIKLLHKPEDEGKYDRISVLPDPLILEILSRLPSTKEAIKTGTLSKRWKHLWTCVPTLIFNEFDHNLYGFCFVLSVDKTLTQRRRMMLNKFQVITNYDIQFVSQFNDWIRYAISCNVQDLTLGFWKNLSHPGFLLDQFFFTASCFTHLTLEGCMFNPTGAISWKNLKSLSISFAKLDEGLIGNILSGSPQLETLVLDCCYGYRRINITSKSVKKFVLSGYAFHDDDAVSDDTGIIEIDAPHILSLKFTRCLCLLKILLLKVSSLVRADLDYTFFDHCETTLEQAEEEQVLKGLILNLRHVKELNIWDSCSKALSGLQAKGFIIPSNVKCQWVTRD